MVAAMGSIENGSGSAAIIEPVDKAEALLPPQVPHVVEENYSAENNLTTEFQMQHSTEPIMQ